MYIWVANNFHKLNTVYKFITTSPDVYIFRERLQCLSFVDLLLEGCITIKEVPRTMRVATNDLYQRLSTLEDDTTQSIDMIIYGDDCVYSAIDCTGEVLEPQVGEDNFEAPVTQQAPAPSPSQSNSTESIESESGMKPPEVPVGVPMQSMPVLSGFRTVDLPPNYARGATKCFYSNSN